MSIFFFWRKKKPLQLEKRQQLTAKEREAMRIASLMRAYGITVTDESNFDGVRYGDVKNKE